MCIYIIECVETVSCLYLGVCDVFSSTMLLFSLATVKDWTVMITGIVYGR